MRKIYAIAFVLAFAQTCFAQNAAILESGLSYFKAGKKMEALPFFKQIVEGNDDQLKQKAIISLSEYWLDNGDKIKRDSGSAMFGNLIMNAIRPLSSKQNASVTEVYTIGVGVWAVIASGTLRSDLRLTYQEGALNALAHAGKENYPRASYYMSEALMNYRNYNKAVGFGDILEWSSKAMTESGDPTPMLKVIDQYTPKYTWESKSPNNDTAKWIMASVLGEMFQKLPDSAFVGVDHIWKLTASHPGHNDSTVARLDAIFSQVNIADPSLPAGIRKGIAWHYLYQYFYELNRYMLGSEGRQKQRKPFMTKLKQLYSGNEKQLLSLAGEFIQRSTTDITGYANLTESHWLDEFSKQAVGSAGFYQGAVLSGDNYLPYLKMEADPARYVQPIIQAYQLKQKRLLNMEANEQSNIRSPESEALRTNIFEAASADKLNIAELLTMPSFATNKTLKQQDINNDLVQNEMFLRLYDTFAPDIDNTLKKINALTPAELAGFDKGIARELQVWVSLLAALGKATANGVEISTIDPFTRKVQKTKIYPKDNNSGKKQEVLQALDKLLQN